MTSEHPDQASVPLSVFYSPDTEEWYVAADAAEAHALWVKANPDAHDYDDPPAGPDAWHVEPDDKLMSISLDDDRGDTTMTMREWTVDQGRGFLCSENY